MFHIDRAFRAEGRKVGAADVCMQRSERSPRMASYGEQGAQRADVLGLANVHVAR
jgi:hypothetical protein